MAKNTDRVSYEMTPSPPANWPELLSKTVEDLSKIVRTEVGLLERTLQRVLDSQTDKVIGMLGLLVAAAYGSLFLLGGTVLLLHLWLDWWLAFVITGVAVSSAGVLLQFAMSSRAKAKSAHPTGG